MIYMHTNGYITSNRTGVGFPKKLCADLLRVDSEGVNVTIA